MKSRLAPAIISVALALSGCVLPVSTPGGEGAEMPPAKTATGKAGQEIPTSLAGTQAAGEPPAGGTPAAFLPLIKDPATIDRSDLENLKIAGVGRVENPVYGLQLGSPAYLPNFGRPEAGCDWLGVAGQVFDLGQQPVRNLIVEVGGQLRGAETTELSLTGLAPAYGPGGYEVTLADRPAASRHPLWVQIFDLSGRPLSEMIYFDTFAGCNQNLILINFEQAASVARVYLPSLLKDRVPAR